MLMPGRYVSDTSQHCVTVTRPTWVWKEVTVACWDVYVWEWPSLELVGEATARVDGDAVEINAPNASDAVGYTFPVTPNVQQTLTLDIERMNLNDKASVEVMEQRGKEWVTLAETPVEVSSGGLEIPFKPSGNYIKVVWHGRILVWVRKDCISKLEWVEEDQLVTICDGDKDKYRFGYNGQEKVNEWSGVGNFLEFSKRGYDSRISRFISNDPLTQKFPWYTPYQFAGNSPIKNIDVEGLEECGADIAQMRMQTGYLKGTVTAKELNQFYQAQGVGAAIGLAAVLDATVLKGKASQFLFGTMMAGSFYDNKSKDPAVNQRRTQEFKENLAWTVLGLGSERLLGSIAKSMRIGSNELRLRTTLRNSDEINEVFSQQGWHAPYKSGVSLAEFKTPKKWDNLVRLSGPNNLEGSWFTTADEVKGLSPAQLRGKFSLKYEPTNITPVSVEAGSDVRVGEAAGIKEFGTKGGGYQIEVLDGKVNYGQTQAIKNP